MKWRRRSSSPITHWMSSSSRIFYICALLCHFKSEWRPAAQSVCLFPQRPSQPASPSPTPPLASYPSTSGFRGYWVPFVTNSPSSLCDRFFIQLTRATIYSLYASILSLIALSPSASRLADVCNRRRKNRWPEENGSRLKGQRRCGEFDDKSTLLISLADFSSSFFAFLSSVLVPLLL